jgi:hypothetical protein
VEFITPSGAKRLEGIDVKFKIDLPMSAVMTKADISICNLTRDDIEYLTTYTSQWIALTQRKRIRLFAGYADALPIEMVFDGDIINAIPTAPPDIWLECKAQSGNYGSTQMFSRSVLVPSSIKSVMTEASGWVGKELEWRATSEKQIQKFDFSGSYTKLVDKLNGLDDVIVFEESDKLIAVDRNAPVRDGFIREISEQSGMIGVPKIDNIGIEAQLFLDTRIKRGDTVHLTSKRVPAADGLYYVYNITHEGHLRGQNWYTTVKARRLDTYGKELAS